MSATKAVAAAKEPKVKAKRRSHTAEARLPVSEVNLRKAATRLLTSALVSTEIAYLQHVLGTSATQVELDDKVMAVRKMPWASIVLPE